MKFYKFFCLVLVCCILPLTACISSSVGEVSSNPDCQNSEDYKAKLSCDLASAQQTKNQAEVEKLSNAFIQSLGSQAGVPEVPDRFLRVDQTEPKLSSDDIRTAFNPFLEQIEREAWWLSRPQPRELKGPPRVLGSIISGSLAARRAGAENSAHLLQISKGAADYLIWSQEQGGKGLFPFPNWQGKNGRLGELVGRLLTRAEKTGKLSNVLVNDWIVNDLGGGDLQYDNGVCGVAMFELYEATRDTKYLKSARTAADWAASKPVVPNWNYNSFSVFLLAHAYRVTGEQRYLQSAKEKARLGIYPGQLQTGRYRGRWADPHNAQLVYHYIIIRGLGALVAVLPENDPELPRAQKALSLALQVGNAEIMKNGVTSPGIVLEALSRLELDLPASSGRLPEENRGKTAELVARYVKAQLQQQRLPVEASAWGLFLEALGQRQPHL